MGKKGTENIIDFQVKHYVVFFREIENIEPSFVYITAFYEIFRGNKIQHLFWRSKAKKCAQLSTV